MLNWAKFGCKLASTDFQLGSDIANLTANYLSSVAKQTQLEYQGKSLKKQEAAYRESQTYYEKQAGRDQEQGRQQREQIGLSGGNAISQAATTAAGSGIDVSSQSVKKAVSDMHKQILNNFTTSAKNEQAAAETSITNARNANQRANEAAISKIWNDYSIESEETSRKYGVVMGALGAAGKWVGGVGEAVGSLWSA